MNSMEPQLDLLSTIRPVAVPKDLFERITKKVRDRSTESIPLYRVAAAAALILLLGIAELWLLRHHAGPAISANVFQDLAPDNMLYHD